MLLAFILDYIVEGVNQTLYSKKKGETQTNPLMSRFVAKA